MHAIPVPAVPAPRDLAANVDPESTAPVVPGVEFDFEPPPPVATTPRTRAIAAEFRLGDDSSRRRRRRKPAVVAPEPPPRRRRPAAPLAVPAAGELLLLAGPSGSGKSSLLRALRRRACRQGVTVIDLRRIPLPADRPTLDLFGDDEPIGDTLRRLARVGLAEVWTWLRPPPQLSEGQRWRLRLALALQRAERATAEHATVARPTPLDPPTPTAPREVAAASCEVSAAPRDAVDRCDAALSPDATASRDGPMPHRTTEPYASAAVDGVTSSSRRATPLSSEASSRRVTAPRGAMAARAVIVCDEFAAVLDRITAHVVAGTLRRAVATGHVAAIVATSHDDLEFALAPTRIARCDFGRVTLDAPPVAPASLFAPASHLAIPSPQGIAAGEEGRDGD